MGAKSDALNDALERLRVEVEKADTQLGSLSPDERVQGVRDKLSKEPSLRAAIDEAVSGWADWKPLPLVSDTHTALLLWDRFYFAHNFGSWLFEAGFRNEVKNEQEILKWLLIDCWQHVGILRWKLTLENMERL